ncbi:MAG: zonular occludens toxin domain-containing protein [bacterium]
MILAFIGTVGSGKTLSAVEQCYLYHRDKHYKIYSNIKLNFPYTALNFKQLKYMIENKEQLQDVVIFLDEVHIAIDSRSSMTKKNKILSYFILQTRKRNVRMLVTTQHLAQIDKRLRDTIDILVFCKNLTNKTSTVKLDVFTPQFIQQEYLFQWADDVKPKRRIIHANPVYPLYDTKEIVDFDEE